MFETETLLCPFGDSVLGDDVDGVTAFHREKGLPREWTVFHVGLGLSAFGSDDCYAWFEGQTYKPSKLFKSLDDWYRETLRAEYAQRYGL